jgi:hypothetical protein
MKKLAFLPPQKIKDVILNIYNKFGNGKPINIQTNKDISEYLKKQNLSLSLLMRSIKEHFRGKPNLDIKLGFERIHKDWDEPLLEKEYGAECRKHGDVALSALFLNKIGRSDISNAFSRLRIDKNELDKSLGLDPLQRNKLCTKEEFAETFAKACETHNKGKPLSYDGLNAVGCGYMNSEMYKHFDSKYELYKFSGIDFIRRDHWSSDDYLEDYHQTCKDCGDRPLSQQDLKLLGKGHLNNWIDKTFNSRNELNEMFRYVTKTFYLLSNGAYVRSSHEVKLGNFLIHNNIPFETNGLIDENARKKYKYDFLVKDINGNDIYIEIWGYSDNRDYGKSGMPKLQKKYIINKKNKKAFYKRKNLKLIGIDGPHFSSLNLNDLQKFFQKTLTENCVKLNDFKVLNSIDLLRASSDGGWDKNKIKTTYGSLCLDNGDKPISVYKLIEMGYCGLAQAIPKYYPGGKKQLDTNLGYKHMRSLTFTLDEIKSQIETLVEENKGIPLGAIELRNMGRKTLVSLLPKYKTNLKKIYSELGCDFRSGLGSGNKKRIKFLKENGSDIIENYNKYGSKKTAELYGVYASTIGRWIKACGGELKKHKFNTVNKEDVAKNLKKLGIDKSAELYGIAKMTFYGWVKQLNLTHLLPSDQNKKTEFLRNNAQEILEYYREHGAEKTAKKYGFHYNTITNLVKKNKK